MKKNVLAVALVAGLGLAGGAAAYNYGTAAFAATETAGPNMTTNDSDNSNPVGLAVAESVSYEMLVATSYNWTMVEDLVFDIQIPDNAVSYTAGFTVRVALNSRCNPHDTATNPASPPLNTSVCAATSDGALFNTGNVPVAGTGAGNLELNANLLASGWAVSFDGYSEGGRVASIRIIPPAGNTVNPGPGVTLRWHNAQLTSLNEFAAAAYASADGTGGKVDAEFWMVNPTNDARFVNSTMSRTILQSRRAVEACANAEGSEVDKYIDVADSWLENQKPKTRFSWDGKLGSAFDATGGTLQSPGDYGSQVIDLGDVTLGDAGEPTFDFWGAGNPYNNEADRFRTIIEAGAGNDWAAFDNAGIDDDVYLVDGTCSSGTIVDQGTVSGSSVTFLYDADEAGIVGDSGANLTVCGFVDSNVIIDDHNNHVTTTFYRVGMYPANTNFSGDPTAAQPTDSTSGNITGSKVYADPNSDGHCDLLPLRYNGSTMEIFTINPGDNTAQLSLLRLTNRSDTAGYVRLEGIDDAGVTAANQVSIWMPAGSSVFVNASQLEGQSAPISGQTGQWGDGAGKWRAVVTAEFPGLVATSLVRSQVNNVLSSVTDSDTRGEQYMRDGIEGTLASMPGTRPSDLPQESTPDFQGNGAYDEVPGGPDANDGPAGGKTEADVNPGL